jgi:hypothetical protein
MVMVTLAEPLVGPMEPQGPLESVPWEGKCHHHGDVDLPNPPHT